MIDPELKVHLNQIEKELEIINKTLKPTRWTLFVEGLWRAVGYIIGLVIAIALFGWMLNMIGVIPALNEVSTDLRLILNNISGR